MKVRSSIRCLIILAVCPATALLAAAQTNVFPASGNVGIGTTSPAYPLDIVGVFNTNSGAVVHRYPNTGGADNGLILGTTAKASSGSGGEGSLQIVSNDASNQFQGLVNLLTDPIPANRRLQIVAIEQGVAFRNITLAEGGGNVGIGTASPTGKLDIQGTSAANAYTAPADQADLRVLSSNNRLLDGGVIEIGGSWGATGYIKAAALDGNAGAMVFGTRQNPNDSTMQPTMVLSGQYVGIGTTSPEVKLHIKQDAVGTGVGDRPYALFFGSNDNAVLRGMMGWSAFDGPNYFLIQAVEDGVAWRNLVLARDGGCVGIGTANPAYPLTVNGTVRAKEVIVDTGWSDYVLRPGYRLPPLSEVERRIKADGHLPGIPTADEVGAGGVSIGEMQAKLLAKIEELTLHEIEQEKEIAALRRQVKELQSQ